MTDIDHRYTPLCRSLLHPAPPTSNIFRRLCTQHIPLGEGMHFKHFPQLHFPPLIMVDFLLMLSRFMSLDGGTQED